MDYEFLLQDRIQKIQQVIGEYGIDNFSISYSGGKDSNVLSVLIDLALPGNRIPRVYADTGIELNAVRDFVRAKCEEDDRFVIVQPKVPIKQMLERVGYPFKSKRHSNYLELFQRYGCDIDNPNITSAKNYAGKGKPWTRRNLCPKILQYQFTPEFKLKVSDLCCDELKKKPLNTWNTENNKPYSIIGLMAEEGGRRSGAKCLVFNRRRTKLEAFQPLASMTKDWEDWFIAKYDIKLPPLYYPPYNFERTGCKGCPFCIELQYELDILEKYFPAERKQCEIIWKPVYDEYRRLGYRLKR